MNGKAATSFASRSMWLLACRDFLGGGDGDGEEVLLPLFFFFDFFFFCLQWLSDSLPLEEQEDGEMSSSSESDGRSNSGRALRAGT